MKTALTIAGSDCSGGAGIQADIKTMTVNGVYAMSVITALTAQNTTGVFGIYEVSREFLRKQLNAVFEDITPDAVKIGMVSSTGLLEEIACCLKEHKAKNIVLDPVMVSTSGSKLIEEEAIILMKSKLLPMAKLVTPNIPEAEVLTGKKIKNKNDMITAASEINKAYGCAVLIKGGHSIDDADDLLVSNLGIRWFKEERINSTNTHGTGCTLSSAIASLIAKGKTTEDAILLAKEYITGALKAGLDLGKGCGPLNHSYILDSFSD